MEASERLWHLKRISKQKADEAEAMKNAHKGQKKGIGRRRR